MIVQRPTETPTLSADAATASSTDSSPKRARWRSVTRRSLTILAILILALGNVWAAMALWIDGPASRWLAAIVAGLVPLITLGSLRLAKRLHQRALISLGVSAVVLAWWFSLAPSNDRDWQPDVARLATADFDGNLVTIHNVRNFDYRTNDDFTEHWETRRYDLDRIVALDLFLAFWGPTHVAHTIVSWEFADGRRLALSVETRKEKGEEYSAFHAFFRQFEIYYVIADERDVIALRAVHRSERVYRYRLRTPHETRRALLVECLQTVNQLAARPRWYHALTANCTSAIRNHFKDVAGDHAFDWRFLLNGYLDELLYELGQIDTNVPLSELREHSDITDRARAAADDPAFSDRIRNR